MPKLNIDYSSPLSAEETYNKVKKLLDTDPGLRKIDSSYTCNFDDNCKSGSAKGSKFKAQIQVNESGDKSTVSMTIDIPLIFSAFKGQVKSVLEKKLKDTLG